MLRNILLIFSLTMTVSSSIHAREFPFADAIPFLGMEQAAQRIKKAVCAIEIQGDQSNKNTKDDWNSLFAANGHVTAKLPYNSGLARAITMEVIQSAINKAEY